MNCFLMMEIVCAIGITFVNNVQIDIHWEACIVFKALFYNKIRAWFVWKNLSLLPQRITKTGPEIQVLIANPVWPC